MKKMTGAIIEDEELTLSDDDAVGYADTDHRRLGT